MAGWVTRAAAVAALFGLSQPHAAAGPIGWSFEADINFQQDYGPNTSVLWGTQTGGGSAESGHAVELFLFNAHFAQPTLTAPGVVDYQFTVPFRLTDAESGQSVDLTFDGYHQTTWEDVPIARDANGVPTAWGLYPTTTTAFFGTPKGSFLAFLGDNRYRIEPYPGIGTENIYATVYVTAWRAAETPEPATAAMAGLGLAGVAGLRLRRR